MTLKVGENVLNGKVIVVEATDRSTFKATFPLLPSDDPTQPLVVEVTTLELLTVAVLAILNQ